MLVAMPINRPLRSEYVNSSSYRVRNYHSKFLLLLFHHPSWLFNKNVCPTLMPIHMKTLSAIFFISFVLSSHCWICWNTVLTIYWLLYPEMRAKFHLSVVLLFSHYVLLSVNTPTRSLPVKFYYYLISVHWWIFVFRRFDYNLQEWDVLSFISSLKSTLRSANAVAVVTFPPSLLSEPFCKRLQHMADILVSVKAIPG